MSTQPQQRIVAVRLRPGEKPGYFAADEVALDEGDLAVVESPHGPDVGTVVRAPCTLVHRDARTPLAPVLRVAGDKDREHWAHAAEREQAVLGQAKDALRDMGLPIKLSRGRMGLGERRAVIEFTSTGQADLRAAYQRLRERLSVRVELRSLGPRDEARLLGGLGRCGNVICCSQWMNRFDPVTVKMAKEQALPISAEGLAGQCGRLKCCLRFEYEQYREANRALPKIGARVLTPEGSGRVVVGHPLRETVSVALDRRGEGDFARTVEVPLTGISPERSGAET